MKKSDKYLKYGSLLLLFTVIALAAPPIILNFTVFSWGVGETHGSLESWISFFGGYLGSIWGGIIGGIVALLVARNTVNVQFKKEIEKNFLLKRIEQIPSLARARADMTTILNEFYEIQIQRRHFIDHNDPDFVEENEYKLQYDIKDLSQWDLSYLEKINDMEIQLSIIDIFDFYRNFVPTFNKNISEMVQEIDSLTFSLIEKEDSTISNQILNLKNKITNNKLNRLNLYRKMENEEIEKVKQTLENINTLLTSLQEEAKEHVVDIYSKTNNL